jgi:hypothetical protein
MKNYSLIIALILPLFLIAQSEKVDPLAILILDGTTNVIGDLESCSFQFNSSRDYVDPDAGLIKIYNYNTIIFDGSNQMLVRTIANKGNRGIWYNGEQVVFYSFTEQNYAIMDAPQTTIETFDAIYDTYGINFPAADFFYPDFTDDLIASFDTIKYLGKKMIDSTECFHIKASNEKMDVQYWIANDIYRLPKRFAILYKEDNFKQYEATFSNWELNREFPNSIFEFVPPPAATEIKILAKTK